MNCKKSVSWLFYTLDHIYIYIYIGFHFILASCLPSRITGRWADGFLGIYLHFDLLRQKEYQLKFNFDAIRNFQKVNRVKILTLPINIMVKVYFSNSFLNFI